MSSTPPTATPVSDQARSVAAKARDDASQMKKSMEQKSSSSNKLLRIVAFLTAGLDVLALGGTAAAGSGLALLLATPLFLLFSPVLVPVGVFVGLAVGGFVAASMTFFVFCSLLVWIFNYIKGRHPVGANKVDALKARISNVACKASDVIHHNSS